LSVGNILLGLFASLGNLSNTKLKLLVYLLYWLTPRILLAPVQFVGILLKEIGHQEINSVVRLAVTLRQPTTWLRRISAGLLSTSQTRQPLRLAASLRLQSGVVDIVVVTTILMNYVLKHGVVVQ